MDRRLLVCTAAARRAKHRLQRAISLSLIGFPLWFCLGTSISSMAQSRHGFPRPSGAGGAVRLSVAHQHVGSWCLGYLHVSGDEVWYEVVKPTRYQEHAFRIERSQITALRQWVLLGQPQNATEIKSIISIARVVKIKQGH